MAGARQAVMATDIKAYQAEAKRIVDDARKMYNGEPLKYSDFSKDVNDRLKLYNCLLYTSDAADDTPCVDLGGRRIIKKKTK
ncbi:Phage Mu protein F like protein [Lactobacillus paracasei ATCC 334] [Lacticaseibacillus rhamnosus]|nr:Phage Mu protein F like protein [Lactobacillus paracasei ATCC 334] [Lacticaseibacillus rhamnosus]